MKTTNLTDKKLQNIMADPDQDLAITDEIKAKLQLSLDSTDRIALQEVKDQLKLG